MEFAWNFTLLMIIIDVNLNTCRKTEVFIFINSWNNSARFQADISIFSLWFIFVLLSNSGLYFYPHNSDKHSTSAEIIGTVIVSQPFFVNSSVREAIGAVTAAKVNDIYHG